MPAYEYRGKGGEGGHEGQDVHDNVTDTTVYRQYPGVDWRGRLSLNGK